MKKQSTKVIPNLLKSVREYKRPSILAPFFVSLEVFAEILIPLIIANLIDYGINMGDISQIIKYGVLLIIISFFALLFGYFSGKFAAIAKSGFASNLRKDIFGKVQNFSFANIDKFSTASIITRVTTDVENVQMAYQMCIRIAVRSPLLLIFATLMSGLIKWQVAVVFLLAMPILAVLLYFMITKSFPNFEKGFKAYDELNADVQENVRGIRVVKSYVQEENEKKKFKKYSTNIYNHMRKGELILAFESPIMQVVMYSCILIVSWLSAQLIVVGDMTTGQLTSMFSYGMQILFSLFILAMVLVMLTISKASAIRINELLIEEPTISSPKDGVNHVANGDIDFENVYFAYAKDKNVLDNINLHIKSGETIGIIGGTGSSKSTLVQLIARLYDVTQGIVKVGGIDVKNYDLKVLRSSVAMVLQKNELFKGTVKENLRWGNENATDEEILNACEMAQASSFIEQMPHKYDEMVEQGGTNVSGGQKQRLCIARALLKKPQILILDDSTSAVDTKTDALIKKSLKECIPTSTKIVIGQRISSVQDADRIIVIDKGKIVGIGTHKELLKSNKIYSEVYTSQNKKEVDND